ncbi:MAG: esterase/lipase family protein [Marinicella sp.]
MFTSASRIAVFSLMIGILLISCQRSKPDLARLYRSNNHSNIEQPPVILIHGIMGSKLRDINSLEEIWFGNLIQLLFSNFSSIKLAIDPDTLEPIGNQLEAFEIADQAAGTDFYRAIIETLQNYAGYQLSEPGQYDPSVKRKLYLFNYDWRQDNHISAKKLSEFIKSIQDDHQDPDLKFDVIAHSMGGLVTRYYLRYGETDVLNNNDFPMNLSGAKNIRKVVLLGTPNLGSVGSVKSFIKGLKVGLRNVPTEVLVTMPSVYQLFPHSINNWIIDTSGNSLNYDVFDIETWQQFQWSIFDPKVQERILNDFDDQELGQKYIETLIAYFHKHIERARRFVWSLTIPVENPNYSLVVMGGDCELTPARLLLENDQENRPILRLRPNHIKHPKPNLDYHALMLEPGDGTVTKASLLAREALDPTIPRHKYSFYPIDYPYFLCEPHSTLTSNINFQDNLLNILLSR